MGMEADMATMNVSLPDPMKDWVESQTETGRYANASDYVRDLIRRDQERNDKIAAMQRFVDDGLKSGIGNRSRDALFTEAVKRAEKPPGNG
jgi:antitoxin ParD1/3/4